MSFWCVKETERVPYRSKMLVKGQGDELWDAASPYRTLLSPPPPQGVGLVYFWFLSLPPRGFSFLKGRAELN